ncbi:uncharacterized protein LOC127805981 isoform X9 [Diospyros lotus]|uniref:uncharacterized protein LOC127805981 isoform X9 n=1 Tax=Diospyros lotus TaxID=55363 RepID=UPI002250AE9D|nr:uncharacterized protein LOC127805981 isoform X9 [Diospyros lotus]
MYLCWRKRRGFSRELVFKEEIDRKLCAFGNYWLVLKGTIFRLSGITAYSSFQKSSHCTEVSKLDWHKMLDPLEAIWGQTFQTGSRDEVISEDTSHFLLHGASVMA